jgi:hypothetical protein
MHQSKRFFRGVWNRFHFGKFFKLNEEGNYLVESM